MTSLRSGLIVCLFAVCTSQTLASEPLAANSDPRLLTAGFSGDHATAQQVQDLPPVVEYATYTGESADGSQSRQAAARAEFTGTVDQASQASNKPDATARPKPAPKPWKGLYFDNDFSFIDDPDHTPVFGESFKELRCGCSPCEWSFGGELRHRYMDERNQFRPEYPSHNTHELWRWRQYADFKYDDSFRAYFEGIDASSVHDDLRPLLIDVDRWDILNAFVDIKVAELDGKPMYFRAGRQELLYGVERLISPLDWANTRRTFEGYKLFWHGDDWNVDAFATRLVDRRPERPDRRRLHQESDQFEYGMAGRFEDRHQRRRLVADHGQRDAEQDGDEQHLQDVAVRDRRHHGRRDAARLEPVDLCTGHTSR